MEFFLCVLVFLNEVNNKAGYYKMNTLWITQIIQKLYAVCCSSFPSALQLRVSFGLLNNLPSFFTFPPSEADYLVSEQFTFYSVRLSHAQPPTWRTRVSLFVWLLPLDLSGMGAPTSSYATAGRVSGALKPHHHDKVETPSVNLE
jgi:hypothetical protein